MLASAFWILLTIGIYPYLHLPAASGSHSGDCSTAGSDSETDICQP